MHKKGSWEVTHVAELEQVVADLWQVIDSPHIITLEGELGAGKTTFVQVLCKHLGVAEAVTSPTFSLANIYQYPGGTIQHLDLYRLNSLEEALQMGIEEYIDHSSITFIEWPELIDAILPIQVVRIRIEHLEAGARKIVLLQGPAGYNDRS